MIKADKAGWLFWEVRGEKMHSRLMSFDQRQGLGVLMQAIVMHW
jgi:hypothetical protein